MGARASAWVATALLGATFLLALCIAIGFWTRVTFNSDWNNPHIALIFSHTWMRFSADPASGLSADFGFYLDAISVMMILVISFISFLVHLYSIGYMQGDPGAGRFFPLLAFFTFSMLGMVVSGNLLATFFFWELVGAASYLLIGFWYTKPAAVAASKKAFILTRFADAFFLMGLLVVGIHAGSFDFIRLNAPAAAAALNHSVGPGLLAVNLLTLGTVGIYLGAWGKSAMFPFHVWLPDAMEGPTPVSSLIHSATMVVAGVFLTARLLPLFSAAPHTLRIVESTGAFTAVLAAAIACTQTDLKRILAYSTLSQLGLMMLALGSGVPGFAASMFHIFTHAFFKCLLFLSAGVVIHAVHSNDVRAIASAAPDGLRKALPRTYWATLAAVLAIAGIWPLAGFFSKEEILQSAWEAGHYGAFLAGLCANALTAFYMSRYFFLVFHGTSHGRGGAHAGLSEGGSEVDGSHGMRVTQGAHGEGLQGPREGFLMTLPILILAVPSIFSGWIGKGVFPGLAPDGNGQLVGHGSSGADISAQAGAFAAEHARAEWLPALATALALAGIAISWYWYGLKKNAPAFPGRAAPAWYRILSRNLYLDELYLFLAKKVGGKWVAGPVEWMERRIVNGTFDWVTAAVKRLAFAQSLLQSGQVQAYIAVALLGLYLVFHFTVTGF
ncbi:MAG: NADH-quinone oxidoreductase subunit L [Fibrobacteria bacterium]